MKLGDNYSLTELYELREHLRNDITWGEFGERILKDGPIVLRNNKRFDLIKQIDKRIEHILDL